MHDIQQQVDSFAVYMSDAVVLIRLNLDESILIISINHSPICHHVHPVLVSRYFGIAHD